MLSIGNWSRNLKSHEKNVVLGGGFCEKGNININIRDAPKGPPALAFTL